MRKRLFTLKHPLVRILSHLFFWIVYLFYHVLSYTFRRDDPDFARIISNLLLTMPVDVLAAYFTAYILLQRYLFKRLYLRFFVAWSLSALCLLCLQRLIMYCYIIPKYGTIPEGEGFLDFNYFINLLNIYVPVGIFLSVKLLKVWYRDQQIQQDLVKQNTMSELALLRSQVNPHFLYNTLNNIDTLVREDQEKASEAIMRLSEIMRYMVYNSNGRWVALSREYSYLQSYIDLQLIRMEHPEYVSLQLNGSIQKQGIAPMLLIPFVENAFKHGSVEKDCRVDIQLSVLGNRLDLHVSNCLGRNDQQHKDATRGIGLANVRRRLELLYPGRFSLKAGPGKKYFTVDLKLELHEN